METTTENGENAFSTTTDANLDLFASLIRTTETEKLVDLLEKSWLHNPELTLKMILYTRDCRNGGGEKFLSFRMMAWLMFRFLSVYNANLAEFVKMGKFHDLLRLIRVKQILKLDFEHEIRIFLKALRAENHLAFKWAPSEGKEFSDLSKIFRQRLNMDAKTYRKFLTEGRKKILLVESILCQKLEGTVDFSKIPSQAMMKYRNTFNNEGNFLNSQYQAYLEKVRTGEEKINSGTLMPYQMIKQNDETSDLLWNDLINKIDSEELKNSIAVCDVSGSMDCSVGENISAMDVAISLSLVLAEVSNHRKIITFSAQPTLLDIPVASLSEKVNLIRKAPFGMNTDIIAVFKLILEKEIDVKNIFVFTDMQFDYCVTNVREYETSYDKCAKLFDEVGRKIPNVIYWNVSGAQSAHPVQKGKKGVSLLSGFSSALFKSVLDGDDISPLSVMKKVLELYNVVYQEVERRTGLIPWTEIELNLRSKAKGSGKKPDTGSELD